MVDDDRSTTARLTGLAQLTRELRQTRTPSETLRAVRRGLAEVYGPITSIILSTHGLSDGEYRLLELQERGTASQESSDPWGYSMLPVHRGGVIAEMIASRGPTIIQSVDWADDPVFGESLSGYDSALAVPFAGDHLPMTWVVLLRRSPARFTDDDLEQTVLRVALIASLLDSQALAQEVAKAHRLIDSEVRRVGQIQRNLLPDPLPEIPGLTIATSYETFGQAGGDLYDFVPLDEPTSEQQHWAIFIADASGHGPSAAVVIAIVQALLHSHPPGLTSPAGLLQHLNSHLCDRPIESSFVTAFLGVCETSSRRFEFSCAGHPPPLLIRASAPAVTYLDSTNGLPLGIDPAERFQQASITLDPGDTLLLYTDGIEESRNPNDAMFGVEGIEAAVRGRAAAPRQLVATVRQAVTAHANGRQASDDQTLVAVSVV